MNYTQNSAAPDWFRSDDSKLYASATMGSSPFNEYYEFDDRSEAIDFISKNFSSQNFIDDFECVQDEIYHRDEVHNLLRAQFGDDHEFSEVIDDADLSSLSPADLSEICQAESCF